MRKRFEKKKYLHVLVLVFLTILLFAVSVMAQEQFALKIIGVIICIILCMCISYKGSWLQIVFCSICYYSIIFAIDSGSILILHFMGKGSVEYIIEDVTDEVLLSVCVRTLFFICIVLINRIFSKKVSYEKLNDNEWFRFMFFPIFSIVAMFFMMFSENMDKKVGLFISVGLLVSDIILFGVINDFARRTEENRKTSLIQERRKNQIDTYGSMELAYNQQKRKVHEFKNHLDCIQGLLQEHREWEALSYIKKINNLAEQHMNFFNTRNPVVDVVINQKYQQAREEGITMITVLDELNGLPIKDKDLVVLLSNLLNNAIEACRKLEPEKRMIKFRFTQNGEQIIISIWNPINESVEIIDNQVRTTKVDKKEHGIGMYNIKEVIEKYGGDGMCRSTRNEFSYTIIFNTEQRHIIC